MIITKKYGGVAESITHKLIRVYDLQRITGVAAGVRVQANYNAIHTICRCKILSAFFLAVSSPAAGCFFPDLRPQGKLT